MLLESARGMSGKKSDRAKMDGLSSAIYVVFSIKHVVPIP